MHQNVLRVSGKGYKITILTGLMLSFMSDSVSVSDMKSTSGQTTQGVKAY